MSTFSRHAWVVAVVLVKEKRSGWIEIALRQGVWTAPSKEESICLATQEALQANKGFTLRSTIATEIQLTLGGAA